MRGPIERGSGQRIIAVVTGSRGEWGYIRPILRLIDADPGLDYALIVTNMHLLSEFGLSLRDIEMDGFRVAARVYMTMDGYTPVTMAKSLGNFLFELPTVLDALQPDLVLLAGDRGEQLMAAVAAAHMNIPVAHIQAGELSGNIDGVLRHAITKVAHLHFAANEEFAERVRRLGEEEFRVHTTGAPLVDELVAGPISSRDELRRRYDLELNGRFILAVQHPVTEEEADSREHVKETLDALMDVGAETVVIYPNADAGSEAVRSALASLRGSRIRLFRNLPRQDYLGLMSAASVVVGNSSSGIMEAPTFGTPAVNIGRRQQGRPQAANVVNVGYARAAIRDAIAQALTPEFRRRAAVSRNPYGNGTASQAIVRILRSVPIDERLLRKKMTY
jgi:UDP-hydrolysing UDP-N-acetyl-D-glucosamine 2-epimerase